MKATSINLSFAAARPNTTVFKHYTAQESTYEQANKAPRLVVGRLFKNQI